MTRKFLMTVAIVAVVLIASTALVLPRPTALAVAVSMAEVLAVAVLTGVVLSTVVFSAGMVTSIQATMGTAIPRPVTIRSTVRPPATDRVRLATWNLAALVQNQKPQPTGGALALQCSHFILLRGWSGYLGAGHSIRASGQSRSRRVTGSNLICDVGGPIDPASATARRGPPIGEFRT